MSVRNADLQGRGADPLAAEDDFLDTGAVSLHYRLERPGSATALVFVNALGTDLTLWDDVIATLEADAMAVRYDKRGHGLSGAPPREYTMGDHRGDLIAILDHAGVARAIVVGISVGGLIALDLAAHCPDRVSGLVLCDTTARIGSPELWEARIRAIRKRGLAGVAESIVERWFAPSFRERQPIRYRRSLEMLTRTPEAGYIGTCATLRDADLRDLVPSIGHRTLVLCGAEDRPTPPEVGRALAGDLPNARFATVPEAGHLPPVERAEVVSAHLEDFLMEADHG